MPDIALKIGQSIAEKTLTEGQNGPVSAGTSDFAKLLEQKMDQQGQTTQKLLESLGMSPTQAPTIQAMSASGLDIQPPKVSTGATEVRTQGKVMELLTEVNRGAHQMESMVQMIGTPGKKFTMQEMLVIQASLHPLVLHLELTGKLVEQGGNSVKTLVQTNVA